MQQGHLLSRLYANVRGMTTREASLDEIEDNSELWTRVGGCMMSTVGMALLRSACVKVLEGEGHPRPKRACWEIHPRFTGERRFVLTAINAIRILEASSPGRYQAADGVRRRRCKKA